MSEVTQKKIGPNVRKLVCHWYSVLAIPPGTERPFEAALDSFKSKERMIQLAREAQANVEAAIGMVKRARDNPWGNDDEAIAGEILRRIEERMNSRKRKVQA